MDESVMPFRIESRRDQPFPVDVMDRGDEYVVAAELPGLEKQHIDVRVKNDRLEIVADFGDGATGGRAVRRERRRGERRRVITLPKPVYEKRVSASYNDGILRVTLQKRRQKSDVEME